MPEKFPGYHWYWDHPLMKPLALSRFVLMRKNWHPQEKRLARLRSLYWTLIRLHDSEICAVCGGPVKLVFHVPDKLWEQAAGFEGSNARSPGGEAAPGVLCPACFDDLADKAGLPYLRWTCSTDDSMMRG